MNWKLTSLLAAAQAALISFNFGEVSGSDALPRFARAGFLNAVVVQPDNKIVIAGSFTAVNGAARANVARLNEDGTTDESFDAMFAGKADVSVLAAQADGKLVVGASCYPPTGLFGLLRLNGDGSNDDTFHPPTDIDCVSFLHVLDDDRILFESALELKQLEPDGAVDPSFNFTRNDLLSVFGGRLAIQADGKILLYSEQVGSVLRFNTDGTEDSTFQLDPSIQLVINVLPQPDGKILINAFIGGFFLRINSDGSIDPTFHPAVYGFPVALQPDGKIILTAQGTFFALYRLFPDGSLDTSYSDTQSYGSSSGNAIVMEAGGTWLVGGALSDFNGTPFTALVRLSADGVWDTSFKPQIVHPATVYSLAAQPDGTAIAGGDFVSIDQQTTATIAILQSDTSLAPSFRETQLSGASVANGVGRQSDGKILAAGGFTRLDGQFASQLLRFNRDGTIDNNFHPAPGRDYDITVQHFVVDPDDRIVVSGFVPGGGEGLADAMTLARLLGDGMVDPSFSGPANTEGPVVLQSDGKVLTAQRLCSEPICPTQQLARFLGDGSLDADFHGPLVTFISALGMQADAKIVLGGVWDMLGDIVQPNLGRVTSGGIIDTAFRPAVNGQVNTITVQRDGKLVIGGFFTAVNGVPVNGLARLNADGTFDPTLNIPTEGGAVYASTQLSNDEIIVGGGFGVATSIVTPVMNQTLPTGVSVPFATLVVAQTIQSVKEVRFFVNDTLVDVETVPLATNGYMGPGHPLSGGIPGFDSGLYGTDIKFLFAGTYNLRVDVVDTSGNISSSTTSIVNGSDSPPPQSFSIGSLVTGTVLITNQAITISADPTDQGGSQLTKVALWVNGTLAQEMKVGSSSLAPAQMTSSYSFTFNPPAPGTYGLVVIATGTNGVTTSSPVVAVTAAAPNKLGNISTRGFVGTGDDVFIGGLIVSATGQKNLVVRAIGPSLGSRGIANPLLNPTLDLYDKNGAVLASNDNWGDSPNKQAIIDSALAPADPNESAILISLVPEAYTAIVRGANGSSGVSLVEAYDVDGPLGTTLLGNISTRGRILTDNNVMIGGFIITGNPDDPPTNVLIRGIGPSLGSSGLSGVLADPFLELHDSTGALIATNDNWRSDQEAAITATTLAPKNDKESALLEALPPGLYTAIVRGVNATTGVGLVEVYSLRN